MIAARGGSMTTMHRRQFVHIGGLATAALGAVPRLALAQASAANVADDRRVRLTGDGLGLTPAQFASLLARLASEKPIAQDSYSLGGIVEELETEFARILGKERAIFMPTGTLANHMAVRALAGGPSRVLVQSESHLYQDEGDCAQTLSGLTLVPLAPGKATFTAADVEQVLEQTKNARVLKRVSVMSIETPVRRRTGERFDAAEMQKVIAIARREGIRLHLDGARLFLQAGYTGENVAETARPFDTVYVSLYKYFNAPNGAMLAGPKSLIDGMYHERRMFGGGLNHAWPFAAVAMHYLNGFSDRFSKAVKTSEDLIRELQRHDSVAIERIPSGTNLFRLRVKSGDAAAVQKRLAAQQIMLPAPARDTFLVGVNETLIRMPPAELTDAFVRALAT
jgi:threonine aldolase